MKLNPVVYEDVVVGEAVIRQIRNTIKMGKLWLRSLMKEKKRCW